MPYVTDSYEVPDDSDVLAYDGWLKKTFKKATNIAKKAVTIVAAPLVIPTAALVKATTHLVSKTGLPGASRVNSLVTQAWRSDTGSLARTSYVGQMAVGAAVGGAILAAPAIGSAVSAVGTGGLATAAKFAPSVKSMLAPTAPTQPAATAVATPETQPEKAAGGLSSLMAGEVGGIPVPLLAGGALLAVLLLRRR